ncbi:MAG: Crp/Fnr family transcriptional regulator [Sedimentisphaerales bacterium]|nr:Crp/Fnr family transcriptional regulator [Sedimentisphaerales bacterium]
MAKNNIIDESTIQRFLQEIPAFELLEEHHLRALASLVAVRKLKAEESLWMQGQQITHFIIVYEGRLRSVRRSSSGGEKLLSTLTPGLHFGLAEMITKALSTLTIIAEKDSTILVIDRKSLRKLLLSNSVICYHLMQTMARAIFYLTRELERASFENVHTRLARLLLKGSAKGEISTRKQTDKTYSASHEEIAVKLGITRETVSRTLADFRRDGLIETSYREITILDRPGLMEYVEDLDQ